MSLFVNTRQVGVKISCGDELLIGPGVPVDETDKVDCGEAKTKKLFMIRKD